MTDRDSMPTVVELILTIFKSLGDLISGKLQLAGQELSQDLHTIMRVAILGLCAGVSLILTLALAGAGLALLLATSIGSTGGAFLLVAGVYLLAGMILFFVVKNRMKKMGGFLSESRADLKRDAEWMKNLTSPMRT
jgi:uncharacterized membrane protein YqjE